MKITLVRHAQPEWVRDGFSVDNPPLTSLGFEQAELLGQWCEGQHFDEVLVSPLVRTQQTAAPMLSALDRPLEIEPWLEEIRNPVWHGTPEEKAAEAWRAEKNKVSSERWNGIDGGESVISFVDRINVGASLFWKSGESCGLIQIFLYGRPRLRITMKRAFFWLPMLAPIASPFVICWECLQLRGNGRGL